MVRVVEMAVSAHHVADANGRALAADSLYECVPSVTLLLVPRNP
jgi:hypothetical protein